MADDEPDNEIETPEEAAAPEETAPEAADADAPARADAPEQDTEAVADAPEEAATPEAAAAAPEESAEQLSAKERRRRARSTHTGEARPVRSPEERHAERAVKRKTKAVRRRVRRLQEREKRAAARAKEGGEPQPAVRAPAEGVRKVRQGVVVSDKADKTITVRIDTARRHRRYEKIVRSSSTLHAHDESNDAHEGDVVRVVESRPLSRSKRWKLVDVLERAR